MSGIHEYLAAERDSHRSDFHRLHEALVFHREMFEHDQLSCINPLALVALVARQVQLSCLCELLRRALREWNGAIGVSRQPLLCL